MLKFFYRLKRRHGVVLFAVIAIMTLLIAMATTAYFTARASYQTVVSNYDFSQTYLSAIAISDMLIEAVTQDSSHLDTGYNKNNFTKLKTEVENLRNTKTAGAADAVITGYTVHGATDSVAGTVATESTILALAASQPVEAGIFDAAKVEIKYIKKEAVEVGGVATGETKHYFTFTTTVYYRDSTISVQDTIINTSGSKSNSDASPFSRFFTATSQTAGGHGSRVVYIDTKDISDDSYFENDYTVIGNSEHAQNKMDGSIVSTGSVYLYQMDATGLPDTTGNNRNDWFIGKDLVITRNASKIDLKGSNLYVGGDLIIAKAGADVIKAANIYVRGNIYYIDAVGVSGSRGITGTVHLGSGGVVSNDCSKVSARISELGGLLANQGYTLQNLSTIYNGSTGFSYTAGPAWDDSELITISNPVIAGNPTGSGKIYKEELTTNITLADAFKDKTLARSYPNYASEKAAYENELNINTSALTIDTSAFMSAEDLGNPETYNGIYSDSYHRGDTVYTDADKTIYDIDVTLELTTIEGDDTHVAYKKTEIGTIEKTVYHPASHEVINVNNVETGVYSMSGSVITFKYDDGSSLDFDKNTNTATISGTKGGSATIKKESGGRITVDVDYYKDGYLLGLKGLPSDGNITYNFHTSVTDDDNPNHTMPVVLKANCNDSAVIPSGHTATPADNDDNNAFSWIGQATGKGEGGAKTLVNLLPDGTNGYGNVVFEMGSYMKVTDPDTGAETMKYVPYVRANDNVMNVPTYYETEELVVGTKDQVDYLVSKNDLMHGGGLSDFYQSGTNYAQDQYKNHIMLISNKNDAKKQGWAVNGDLASHIFCGYLYAPNGTYSLHSTNERHSVFGGIIVSVYDTKMSYFYYCSPDPDTITEILKTLHAEEFNTDPVPTEGIWSLQQGKNYLG